MRRCRQGGWIIVGVGLAVGALALGAERAEGRADPRVRFVYAIHAGPPVDVIMGGFTRAEMQKFTDVSSYAPVAPGEQPFLVVPSAGGEPLVDGAITVENDKYYTVLTIGTVADPSAIIVTDDNSAPASGQARARLINVSPDAGAVDAGTRQDLWFENIPYRYDSDYQAIRAGQYNVSVWPTNENDPLLVLPNVVLKASEVHTLFLMGPKTGGGLTLVDSTDASFGAPTLTRTPTATYTATPTPTGTSTATPSSTATSEATVTPMASPTPPDIYLPAGWRAAPVDGR